jgi:hypothetical protein
MSRRRRRRLRARLEAAKVVDTIIRCGYWLELLATLLSCWMRHLSLEDGYDLSLQSMMNCGGIRDATDSFVPIMLYSRTIILA